MRAKDKNGLTPLDRDMLVIYAETRSAAEAYRRTHPKANDQTATSHGKDWLKKPAVKAAIERMSAKALAKCEITTERIIAEYAKLAFLDPRRFFDGSGNLKPIAELSDDEAAALAGIDHVEEFSGRGKDRECVGYTKKIRFADKRAALDSLARIKGMFVDKVEHTGKDGAALVPVINVRIGA